MDAVHGYTTDHLVSYVLKPLVWLVTRVCKKCFWTLYALFRYPGFAPTQRRSQSKVGHSYSRGAVRNGRDAVIMEDVVVPRLSSASSIDFTPTDAESMNGYFGSGHSGPKQEHDEFAALRNGNGGEEKSAFYDYKQEKTLRHTDAKLFYQQQQNPTAFSPSMRASTWGGGKPSRSASVMSGTASNVGLNRSRERGNVPGTEIGRLDQTLNHGSAPDIQISPSASGGYIQSKYTDSRGG